MNTPDSTTGRESHLDAELSALMSAPVNVDRLLDGAARRIARRRAWRLALPWLLALLLTSLVGPTLWQLFAEVFAGLQLFGLDIELTGDGLAQLAHQMPIYVWAFVGGIGVTVATMFAES